MDTLFGLPAHPLLVHLPVVLVPLCAIAVVVMALHRGTMARLGWVVLGLSGVALVATFLAAEAGEALEESVKETSALEAHTEAGDQFRLIMLGFFVVVAAMVLWDWYQGRSAGASGAAAGSAGSGDGSGSTTDTGVTTAARSGVGAASLGGISLAIRAVAVVAAVVATYFVIDVGHSGAKSSWGDVKISSEHREGGEGGDSDG